MAATSQEQRQGGKRLWSKEEDQLLLSLVTDLSNPKWAYISKEFNEKSKLISLRHISERTNKQCRERWQNHLNPHLKNNKNWTNEEHRALFRLFRQNSHKWCTLAQLMEEEGFQKRSDNNIKNYFYSALKRQVKKMNEVIKESNRQIKKIKSQKHNYSQKYVYKQRLSVQRQCKAKMESQSFAQSSLNQFSCTNLQDRADCEELHIIKELQPELISKILLIAEDKANKKYVISSNSSHQFQTEASKCRNQLIDIITEMGQEGQKLEKQEVLKLAKNMLDISRKCKKKTNPKQPLEKPVPDPAVKNTPVQQANQCEYPLFVIPVNKSQTEKHSQKSHLVNYQQFMEEDKEENRKPLGYMTNSQGIKNNCDLAFNQVCFNPFHINKSFDFSNVFRSGEIQDSGCYSNFGIPGMGSQYPYPLVNSHSSFFENSQNLTKSRKPEQNFSILRQIRVEEKRCVQDLPPQLFQTNNHNIFFDFPNFQRGPISFPRPDNQMRPHHLSLSCPVLEDSFAKEVNKFHNGAFETVPNKEHGQQENQNLCRSWVYPEQPMNFRSSLDRSLDFSNNGNIFQLPPKSNNDFQP